MIETRQVDLVVECDGGYSISFARVELTEDQIDELVYRIEDMARETEEAIEAEEREEESDEDEEEEED